MRVRGKPANGNERSMARDFDRDAAPDLSKDGWPEKFAGTGYEEAGRDIELGPYAGWIDRERIVRNAFARHREFGAAAEPDRFAAPSAAARYYFDERAGRPQPREARTNGEDGG